MDRSEGLSGVWILLDLTGMPRFFTASDFPAGFHGDVMLLVFGTLRPTPAPCNSLTLSSTGSLHTCRTVGTPSEIVRGQVSQVAASEQIVVGFRVNRIVNFEIIIDLHFDFQLLGRPNHL